MVLTAERACWRWSIITLTSTKGLLSGLWNNTTRFCSIWSLNFRIRHQHFFLWPVSVFEASNKSFFGKEKNSWNRAISWNFGPNMGDTKGSENLWWFSKTWSTKKKTCPRGTEVWRKCRFVNEVVFWPENRRNHDFVKFWSQYEDTRTEEVFGDSSRFVYRKKNPSAWYRKVRRKCILVNFG